MNKTVLITGGAGFIGSHLTHELLEKGYNVRILDSLVEQVHGTEKKRPEYLSADAELIVGDVRDRMKLRQALMGVDAVYHLAALVGVGQSMYEIQEYTNVNNLGTAILLEELIKFPIEKLVVASSMSIYGEGLYTNNNGKLYESVDRNINNLKKGIWESFDENGDLLNPIATPETKKPSLSSVYALSKYDQERLCLMVGQAYNIPAVALRFFNVYGPNQALSNPYTGVLAIFASRFLNDNPPLVFEDGNQKRDFVSVYDVAKACRLALESENANGQVFNVGSGQSFTIREIATRMANILNKSYLLPEITGKYRIGDIRHCFSDISHAKNLLGYVPSYSMEKGMEELALWLKGQIAVDKVDQMKKELEMRGLAV